MRPIFLLIIALGCTAGVPEQAPHCEQTEVVRLVTADEAEVVLHRHPGAGPPVLVIHGIASNHRSWDLTKERSIADVLQVTGFDTWLIDLRGHGEAMVLTNGAKQRYGWSIDDYGAHDLRAAIQHIQQVRGGGKVALVGHSMGGMVAAAYHGHHGDDAVSALVIVGSPIEFSERDFMMNIGDLAMKMGSVWRSLAMHTGAEILGQIPGPVPLHGEGILFNPKNLAPEIRTLMLQNVVSPVSRDEMKQFSQIFKHGKFISADGTIDYGMALSTMNSPLLAISGGSDKIVPPDRVSPWVDAVATTDTTYIEASMEHGFSADYGHLDLIMGDAARHEIHEPIRQWLSDRIVGQ